MQRLQIREAKALGLPSCSAALGDAPGSPTLVPGGIGAEAKQTMETIGAVLRHCGLGSSDIVKATVFLADMAECKAFNEA